MKRRLYFLFPRVSQTERVVAELSQNNIARHHMHVVAREDIALGTLPASTRRQRRDVEKSLERVAWDGNLGLFFVAALALVAAVIGGIMPLILAMAAVMIVTFLLGLRFTRIPNVHLDEFRDAIAHGEILLMVDVPPWQVRTVEDRVHKHHPEAVVGGVGWAVEAFGL